MTDIRAKAYKDGLMKAADMLRIAATEYQYEAKEAKKIHIAEGAGFAATLLQSWANGIEIEANREGG